MKLLVFAVIITICQSSSCDKGGDGNVNSDTRFKVFNNSDSLIGAFLQYNYPDTSILPEDTPGRMAIAVDPGSSQSFFSSENWESLISRENPSNTVMVFVYSKYVNDNYS